MVETQERVRGATGPDLSDLLFSRYRLGGRVPGVELDCLGVAKTIAERHGRPGPDGWPSILEQLREGRCGSGFPPGWFQVQPVDGKLPRPLHLDVLVSYRTTAGHPGCAIVVHDVVWTAGVEANVFCSPLEHWLQHRAPDELWRYLGDQLQPLP